MKELEYIKIINNTLTDSSLLGDDCAWLRNLKDHSGRELCVTQDTLVEGVHFLLETTDAYELGQKAVNVNLSDLAAAGAEPEYLMISLSLPASCDENFVRDFYAGVQYSLDSFTGGKAKVAGGDLTASEKVCVSVCAIGAKYNSVKVSRSCAKAGDIVAVTGTHGDSAGGLKLLTPGGDFSNVQIADLSESTRLTLIKKHLVPCPQNRKSEILMKTVKEVSDVMEQNAAKGCKQGQCLAMMDSSDGLFDALYKLSQACGLAFDIDYDSIPVSAELKQAFSECWKDLAYWGGEDFELVFCTGKEVFDRLDNSMFYRIGTVSDRSFDEVSTLYRREFEAKSYRHFE